MESRLASVNDNIYNEPQLPSLVLNAPSLEEDNPYFGNKNNSESDPYRLITPNKPKKEKIIATAHARHDNVTSSMPQL